MSVPPGSRTGCRPRPVRRAVFAAVVLATVLAAALVVTHAVDTSRSDPVTVRLPPVGAGVDYQLGGAYAPASDVRIVVRDHEEPPAAGLYNICYVNAFQAQPGQQQSWSDDLLLKEADGEPVIDEEWDEVLLDISTSANRARIADTVGRWVDDCAAKGYDAVEPDNYDSYTRSKGLLTSGDAKDYITLLSARAHARELAVAQKNTAELAEDRVGAGLDFAVTEQCADYDECGTYAAAFDGNVIVVEYSDPMLRKACSEWGGELSIVRRDLDLVTPAGAAYVRGTCADV